MPRRTSRRAERATSPRARLQASLDRAYERYDDLLIGINYRDAHQPNDGWYDPLRIEATCELERIEELEAQLDRISR